MSNFLHYMILAFITPGVPFRAPIYQMWLLIVISACGKKKKFNPIKPKYNDLFHSNAHDVIKT